jgi:multiple sugar transport system substrate-binding protein
VRDDLLDGSPAPANWDEVLAMAQARPGAVAIPLAPAQAICAFLTLCANAGSPAGADAGQLVEPGSGLAAIELLGEVYRLGPPGAATWEPPDVLARLTSSDELAYVPLVFGFATYARAGVRTPCRFLNLPSAGAGPIGSILGGAGLAVTAASVHPHEAAAFAAFASSAEAQRTLVGPAGGQPGSRAAWNAPELDSASGGFFSGTSASIEHAWVRPRERWWPAFQLTGGRILSSALEAGIRPRECFKRLDILYRDCIVR